MNTFQEWLKLREQRDLTVDPTKRLQLTKGVRRIGADDQGQREARPAMCKKK